MAKKANSSAIKSVSVTKKEKEQPQKKSGATQIKSVSSSWSPSQTDLGNINKLTQLLQGMTDEQHTVLRAAVANNQDIVVKGRTARPEDSAYYQYAQAIRELTDEDGTVNYDPDGYRFNPYSEGLPDETARKAYESLSYKDQLMLEIGKNGKPKTPDFGDPSVDTGVYDRYQQALQRVEADEKAAAEAEKIRVKQEADDAATKAVEELYKANRGDWNYDPKADVKAIKESNKDITLTQTELKEIFEGLQSQYDWDDEAYAKWTSNGRVVDTGARTTSSHDPSKNTVAAMNSAEIAQAQADMETYLRARNNTAFMKAFNKLTGKDTIEYYLKKNRRDADGSFADDAKYVVNQAVQGIGDFVGGAATLAGLATKAQIDTALAPAWFITNEGKRWTMEEAREMFGSLDTIMSIAETSGSAAGNAYNQSGVEKASGTAKFIGGLARAFTSSMTSGIAGSMLASAAPALTSTVDVSAKLGDKAPTAVKALAKLVPEIKVGVNQLPFLTQAFGSGYQEAKIEGYNEAGALVWGGWTALAEGIPESISWNWSSATGSSIKSKVYGGLNQGAAKNATKKGLKNLMTKTGDAGAMKILAAMNAEGMEEVMTNYLEWFGRETILKQDVDLPTLRENLTAYASGALLSAITQGFSYATTTPARKQAETIVDGMMNGQSPTAEQVQALDDANNEEAAKLPLSNEQLETAVGNGLHVDEKIVTAYRTVNNELITAEKRATDALHNLQQMNANGVPFGDPTRVAAVKAFTDARKDIVALTSKRAATQAKYLGALDGMIQDTEAALAEVEAAQQQVQQEYAQWQVDEMLATDPQGLMTATQELQSAVNEELVTLKAELKQNGMGMDIGTRTAMMQRVNALGESAVKLQQMADAAYAAIVPTIAEQSTSENDGANTPPENGTPVQAISPDMEEQAQGYVATMRHQGATTEEIIRSVEEQAAAEEADEADAAFAEAVKAIVSTNTPSLAQTLIANNASTASEKTIIDLLNRARQKGTDEAGIALARELLVNSGAVDNSADAIKAALRNTNIAPTAEERANIAATYGSYDTYRRAVAGVVPLGGVGKQGSVSIDQAIGALQQDFPGQVTGDDRAAWLYDFAQNNPKGKINYDGDLDADSAQLWAEIKAENRAFFGSPPLIAVHSLSAENAAKAIENGGLPVPSIAITTPNAGVPDYGDVTFVMGRETVDPAADARNKLFDRDAFTPMFPDVVEKVNPSVRERFVNYLRSIKGLHREVIFTAEKSILNDKRMSAEGFERQIKDSKALKAIYLHSIGVEPVVDWLGNIDSHWLNVYMRGKEDAYVEWANKLLEGWSMGQVVLNPDTDEFEDVTPERMVRAIDRAHGENFRNAYDLNYGTTLHYDTAQTYDSLEALEKISGDLLSGEHFDKMDFAARVADLAMRLDGMDSDYLAGMNRTSEQQVGEVLAVHSKAVKALHAAAKMDEYDPISVSMALSSNGYDVDDSLVQDIADMLTGIRTMHRPYFEAKPDRVVGISEVKMALLPEGKYPSLEKMLKDHGIEIAHYNGDTDNRVDVLKAKAARLMFGYNRDSVPEFIVPDFTSKETKYGKKAAADWLDQTHKAGTADADIAAYAGTRKLTGTTAKERAFWESVEGAMAQTRNGKPKVMAFKPTPQQETQGDVVKVLDETSPYMQADSTDMKHASSTYPTVRKLASIKNDIQNTLGFRYSDEHFIRAQRKAGAVAYYEPTGRFVVSDDTNNLPAFLHEAGHHMALDQYNEDEVNAFKQNVPRKFLDEYPKGAQAQEAGAEMFRAWMMDPEFMERNYPETFDAMRNALGKGKYNRLRDESAAVRKWMDADVEKRVSSTQVTTREQEKVRKKNFAWSDFIKKEADAEYGYKKLDRIMQRNGVTLAAGADARAACARTSSEAIHALMFDGMYDPKTGQKVAGSLTETTRGLIVTAEDKQTLEVYLELKQSLDRYEKNNKDWTFSKNVCTPAEAKAYVESVENNKKNVVDAAKNLWKWLEKYRHTQLSGAIPQSVIDEWDTLNPHYIPQTRVFTDNVRAAVRGSKTGDGTGVNRRKVGSTRDFLSPIDAIVQMVAKTKTAAMKHETLLALQEYYDAGEAYAGDFLHEVEPGVHITPVDGLTVTKAAVNALERGGMDAETLQQVNDLLDGNSPETRVYRYGAPNGRNNNIVAITQDGHTRYFEVRDQDLMDAIAPMNRQQLGSFLTAVSKMNRQISALITSQNPLFAGSNAIRDFVTGYAFGSTKNPIKYVGDYVSAARDVAKNTDAARQYRAMGGGGGLAQSLANADQVNDVTEAMFGRAGDDRNTVKRALDTVGNKLDEFNGGIETIPRLAEYKRQLENGASYAEAIKAAKNLTTDFSTGGTHSKIMNTLWRFYGAQVNGLYKTFNLFADKNNTEQTKKDFNKTIGAISGIAVAGALWHFALHLLDDEDEYAALPDYIKDDYYIIPYGGGKFVRIPKPNDPLLVALDSMGRNLADTALRIQADDDAGDVVKDEGIDLLGDIASILLPFGDWNKPNPLGSNFVGAPVMQWAYNKTWTGADIVPSYMEDVSPALQYDDKTSWVSRQFGKAFNISPMKLDNLFDQSSGVIGEVVDAFSAGVDAARQGGIVEGVGSGLKEALLSRFLVDSAYSQNVTGGFHDAKDELTQFIEDVERNIDMENLPYSPMMKNLGPSETNTAYKEAKDKSKKINELSKKLSDIGKQATQYTQQGNEEKAREMKYKQQELAAEASLIIADFFDKWKNQ